MENRIQASLTANWHDKGADWRADWKNKKTEIRGGPGPTLRRQSHAPGSWDKARIAACSSAEPGGGDVPTRQVGADLREGVEDVECRAL